MTKPHGDEANKNLQQENQETAQRNNWLNYRLKPHDTKSDKWNTHVKVLETKIVESRETQMILIEVPDHREAINRTKERGPRPLVRIHPQRIAEAALMIVCPTLWDALNYTPFSIRVLNAGGERATLRAGTILDISHQVETTEMQLTFTPCAEEDMWTIGTLTPTSFDEENETGYVKLKSCAMTFLAPKQVEDETKKAEDETKKFEDKAMKTETAEANAKQKFTRQWKILLKELD